MIYGFSGPERAVSPTEASYVLEVLEGLTNVTGIVTGGARGIDSLVARLAVDLFGGRVEHRLVLPDGHRFDRQLERELPQYVVREFVPGGFLRRNDRLVLRSETLVAFPERPVEELRSGTWSTIRRARKRGIPILLHPLSAALLTA